MCMNVFVSIMCLVPTEVTEGFGSPEAGATIVVCHVDKGNPVSLQSNKC